MDHKRHHKHYQDKEEFISSKEQTPTKTSNQQKYKNVSRNTLRKVPDRPSPPPPNNNSQIIPPLYVGHRPSPPLEATNSNNKTSQTRTTSNVGATVAALAAVLATAPTAAARPNSSRKEGGGLLSVPNHRQNSRNNSSDGNNLLLSRSAPMLAAQNSTASTSYLRPFGGQSSAVSFHSSPISPSSSTNVVGNDFSSYSKTPLSSQPQGTNVVPFSSSSTSLRRSIRNEFDAFKRRSISELSLVLEVLKTATNRTKYGGIPDDDIKRDCWGRGTTTDDEYYQINHGGGNRHFMHSVGPVESSSGSISAVNSLRRSGFVPPHHHSTGNLATPFSRKSQRRMALRRKIQWERLSPAAIQRQIVQVQEEKAMLQAPTAPISAAKFVAYVQERRKKRILFKGEFLMIQRSVDPQRLTTEVGIRMGEKNQYPDTLPYDQSRVILEHRPGVEDSHYINASYVNSWLRERAYVVTQSVRNKQASNEFWRCVWEIGANTIVMLTKIFDFMRVVCLQYWPQTQFQFGEIHVETLDTRTYAHFVIRTFRLRKTGGVGDLTTTSTDGKGETQRNINDNSEERIVKHFHFTEWELNSFPYISAFVEVRRRVRQWMERSPVDSPIVVHCSNGGGRSGAFLAVDANLELLQRTGQLDVFEYARTLINSRQNLISSVEQYTFIYDVLCEAVLCNVQPMAMHQLKDRSTMYKARKNRELMELQDSHENKLLTMLTAPLRIGDCAGGHRLENRGKNRDVMVVPPDHARPYLQTLHGESKDYTYINAVEVDGFTRKAEFIVTEWPKQQTLDSFWTLVFDHNVHTVICLTNQPTDTKARKIERV
uniref:Uncharacterized protein n=1 Tax=Meloidogyne incognita TaxID=6306 RepID=A0A914M7T6_MELIC